LKLTKNCEHINYMRTKKAFGVCHKMTNAKYCQKMTVFDDKR